VEHSQDKVSRGEAGWSKKEDRGQGIEKATRAMETRLRRIEARWLSWLRGGAWPRRRKEEGPPVQKGERRYTQTSTKTAAHSAEASEPRIIEFELHM
jgi:hypothetical protein